MTPVFLDTSFAYALTTPADSYHSRAVQLQAEVGTTRRRQLTHRGVLLEIGNALSKRRRRAAGVRYLTLLENDPDVEIVEVTPELFAAGFALFADRPDKDWGLVDCVSYALMTARGLTDALTADDHFAQAGFTTLLLP